MSTNEIHDACNNALEDLDNLSEYLMEYEFQQMQTQLIQKNKEKVSISRQDYLTNKLSNEINERSKNLKGHYYGWKNKGWELNENNNEMDGNWEIENNKKNGKLVHNYDEEDCNLDNNYEERMRNYRKEKTKKASNYLRDHEIDLQDPHISKKVFDTIVDKNKILHSTISRSDKTLNEWRREWAIDSSNLQQQQHRTRSSERRNLLGIQRNNLVGGNSVQGSSDFDNEIVDVEEEEYVNDDDGDADTLCGSETGHRQTNVRFRTSRINRLQRYRSSPRNPEESLINRISVPTSAFIRLEKELAEKEASERLELATKFKATPVPASSLMPKYHELVKSWGKDLNELKPSSKNEIKPFHFGLSNKIPKSELFKKITCQCQEKNTGSIVDAVLEIELEKIQAMKRKQLEKRKSIVNSKIVQEAGRDGIRKAQKLKENEKKSGLTEDHSFKPSINTKIPDFKKLQDSFNNSILAKKMRKELTVPKPFNAGKRPTLKFSKNSEKNQKKQDISCSFHSCEGGQRPRLPIKYQPPVMSKSMNTNLRIPRTTNSEHLKEKHRESINSINEAKKKEEESFYLKSKSAEVVDKIRTKAQIDMHKKEEQRRKSVKSFEEVEIRHEREYKMKLEKMQRKLNSRPCLFENEELYKPPLEKVQKKCKNAKKFGFREILANAGLDLEEFENIGDDDSEDFLNYGSRNNNKNRMYNVNNDSVSTRSTENSVMQSRSSEPSFYSSSESTSQQSSLFNSQSVTDSRCS